MTRYEVLKQTKIRGQVYTRGQTVSPPVSNATTLIMLGYLRAVEVDEPVPPKPEAVAIKIKPKKKSAKKKDDNATTDESKSD